MRFTTTEIEVQRIRADLWLAAFNRVLDSRGAKYGQAEAIKAANAALDRFDQRHAPDGVGEEGDS